jgi:pilus assembly protein CpaB
VHKRALFLAFAFACLGAALLYVYLRRFEQEASGGPPVKLLVALKPVAPGTLLTDEMLATREVPVAYVENRAVRESERAKVIGLRVATPVQAQQTLMWTDLAIAADDRRDLSSLVQPGMRAVSVRAMNDDKSFALIRPGDRVDVIATMPASETSPQRESVVLLQNVLVLAVGLDTGSEPVIKRTSGEPRDLLLSLSLTVPETQLLSLAVEKGRVSVALRNPDDVRTTEGLADMTSNALTDSKARANVQGGRKSGPIRLESQEAPQRGGNP